MSSPAAPVTPASFYVIGGTLKRDAACYVQRQADKDLLSALEEGKFCYVLTSRQMGKSSLMVRTAVRLRQQGTKVAVLDLTSIGQNLEVGQWYLGLLNRIGQQLELEDELEDYWDEHKDWSPLQRWTGALRDVVLEKCKEDVVIFVDEIDATRSLPFSADEFFAAIREFYNRRAEEPELGRLTFCLLGVATPSDLIQDVRTTPFNIGHRIELTDFSEEEASVLLLGLGRDIKTGKKLLERVLYWSGGHPYLTQRLCQAVASDPAITGPGAVDRLCEALFLSRSAREKDDNLLFVRDRILRSKADLVQLLELYRQVREHKRVKEDPAHPLHSILKLAGIARIVEGYLLVRNRIYYRVFDKEWVETNLPVDEVARQKAAYRRGVMRTAALASVVVLAMTGLVVWALIAQGKAKRSSRVALMAVELAQVKTREAEEAKLRADDNAGKANDALKLARDNADKANAKAIEAEARRREAVAARLRAEASERKLRIEALRIRAKSADSQSETIYLTDRLIRLAPREESVWYHSTKASALLQQGKIDQAIGEAGEAIAIEPDHFNARTTRGYGYLLNNKPKEALADFDHIKQRINPRSALNELNRAVTLAILGQYAEAEKATNAAIANFPEGQESSFYETEISPDVRLATGRTVLVADSTAFRTAINYLHVLLASYVGAPDFGKKLAEANQKTDKLRPSTKEDVYLHALNWAWLQETRKASPPDYGSILAQAVLWERAGFSDWAACYYQRFQEKHRELHDKRYDGLSQWVDQQNGGRGHGRPGLCQQLRAEKMDPQALEQEAREHKVKGQYQEAEKDLTQALRMEPENSVLLVLRAGVRQLMGQEANAALRGAEDSKESMEKELAKLRGQGGESAQNSKQGALDAKEQSPVNPAQREAQIRELESKIKSSSQEAARQQALRTQMYQAMLEDCQQILKRDARAADAYYLRGIARSWVRKQDEPYSLVLADFREAVKWEPTHASAMWELSRSLDDDEKTVPEALKLVQEYNRLFPGYGFPLAEQARLHLKLKQFAEARVAIERAIAVGGDVLDYYKIRADAERGLKIDEHQVLDRLALGYRQAGDILKRRGDREDVTKAYDEAWKILSEMGKAGHEGHLQCDAQITVCERAEIISASGAPLVAAIASLEPGQDKTRIVRIDRGSEDGLVSSAEGEVFSRHQETDGHTRDVEQIATAEVLGVGAKEAIVRITMSNPSEDGLARRGDLVQFRVRVPSAEKRSALWNLARFHIGLTDLNSQKEYNDFRTLYSSETPEMANQIHDEILAEIHKNAQTLAADSQSNQKVEKGKFAGKALQEALEQSTREDVVDLLEYLFKYPHRFVGYRHRVAIIFRNWVRIGAPTE